MALTAGEQELCAQIGFDVAAGEALKAASGQELEQLQGNDLATGQWGPIDGLSVKINENAAQAIIAAAQPQLPEGYIAFYSTRQGGRHAEVSVLKTADRLDILRVKSTSGGNYDLAPEDVVARLQQWQQLCSFTIVGASHDWTLLEFETLPADLDAFAQEIYAFCPDTIDQHFGCFNDMAEVMEEAGKELPAHVRQVMESQDWNDPTTAGLAMLKCSLEGDKSLFLWWD